MNTLIVFTHPSEESLNRSFLNSTLEGLRSNPHIKNIDVLDLYRENFNPALIFNSEIKRRDMHKDPELELYRQKITQADTVIFIYPIWWGRPPAMLMGFIDRMMASGFAFKQEKGHIMPEGLLKGKKVICVSTMKGPTGYTALLLNNAHKTLMRKAVFNFVGIKDIHFFEFGFMEKSGGRQGKNLEKVKNYMTKLKSAAA
ncbi:NAD(P)H-dependent oxidoreductase [Oceanispirochaeta sp.]|jgi:NAD(P)H dehydrogenase (quinone)|uniref:NAD(P)H-dependent oxidoreductase n=1 Tax=Oceanispirochaeta sp. TaxID=2035350 RepID=UPI0026177F59|nr:NAD(P)H-dependent oxidoreductase [Oceanispirochaeta sp.]MDA3957666.1 NAD(P)H-dependent oxidoreductase [Oceanispirochaeta sp.]